MSDSDVNVSDLDTCECGSVDFNIDKVRGEITCTTCGLVFSDFMMSYYHEKKAFSPTEKNKRIRVGDPMNVLLPDKGLSTTIDRNTTLSPEKKQQFRRLTRIQNQATWRKQNLSIALTELRRVCSQLSLSSQVANASGVLYRKVYKKDLVKGRSIRSMILASIYICCRQAKIPISLKEISDISDEPYKAIKKAYKVILKEFKLKIINSDPISMITRIGGELKIDNKMEHDAIELLKKIFTINTFQGRDPKGIASASIYIVGLNNENKYTQNEISKAGKITEVTLRNRIKDFKKILKTLED